MRTNKRTFSQAELNPESLVAPLDVEKVFGRTARLEVELGCGDGSFLVACATAHPERDFLGVEQMPGRVRSACRKIGADRVANARVLRLEISHALGLLPRASVDVFHLLFPDPWPKRRHQHRRTVTRGFLRATWRALRPDGSLRIKTDEADYFQQMQEVVRQTTDLFLPASDDEPRTVPTTTFEKRFLAAGAQLHGLVLRKLPDGR